MMNLKASKVNLRLNAYSSFQLSVGLHHPLTSLKVPPRDGHEIGAHLFNEGYHAQRNYLKKRYAAD
ncbi:hypothetical protein [Candidatus Nucleicultrix amoebiphila]|nr:hypothetical protein [Candidatus Nucleicultrix amoebiphila]